MYVSNVLGTVNPIAQMAQLAHEAGALMLVDGAQAVPHMPVDVQALDADFFTFSGHKMIGPTGSGILYGKRDLLEAMPPWMGGGDMIATVRLEGSTWNDLPYKFEAGNAFDCRGHWLGRGGRLPEQPRHGQNPRARGNHHRIRAGTPGRSPRFDALRTRTPIRKARWRRSRCKGIHAHDVAQLLDAEGIAVRAGHHCAMPLHDCLNIPATARASFYLYNTLAEVDALIEALYTAKRKFSV